MVYDPDNLPDDKENLKEILERVIGKYNEDVDYLKEQIALLQHALYGREEMLKLN